MPETFSDISDVSLRESLNGFVDQIKSGKPPGVITMVMKSRVPNQPALWDRVLKAAGAGGKASAPAAKPAIKPAVKPASKPSPKPVAAKPKQTISPMSSGSNTPTNQSESSPQSTKQSSKPSKKESPRESSSRPKKKKSKSKKEALMDDYVNSVSSDSDDESNRSSKRSSVSMVKNQTGYSNTESPRSSSPSPKRSKDKKKSKSSKAPLTKQSSIQMITDTSVLTDLTPKQRKALEKQRKQAETEAENLRMKRLEKERAIQKAAAECDPNEALYGSKPSKKESSGCCIIC